MNITPMDMQVVIPKVTEVGKAQQVRDQQNITQHEHGAVQFQQDADHKQKQVQNMDKSEGKKIKDEERNQHNQQGSKKRQAKGDRNSEEETSCLAVDTVRGRHIDIKM